MAILFVWSCVLSASSEKMISPLERVASPDPFHLLSHIPRSWMLYLLSWATWTAFRASYIVWTYLVPSHAVAFIERKTSRRTGFLEAFTSLRHSSSARKSPQIKWVVVLCIAEIAATCRLFRGKGLLAPPSNPPPLSELGTGMALKEHSRRNSTADWSGETLSLSLSLSACLFLSPLFTWLTHFYKHAPSTEVLQSSVLLSITHHYSCTLSQQTKELKVLAKPTIKENVIPKHLTILSVYRLCSYSSTVQQDKQEEL